MTFVSNLTAVLLDYDASTVVPNALDDSFAYNFLDAFSGSGTGSIAVPMSNPDYVEVQRGRYVQFSTNGVECFTFKIEGSPQAAQIMRRGRVEEVVVASGRDWGCAWDEPIVDVEPLAEFLDYSYRMFNFASGPFPNASGWGQPTEQYEWQDFAGAEARFRIVDIKDTGPDPDDPADDVVKLYQAPVAFPWPNAPKNGNGFAPTPTYVETYWVTADGAAEDDVGRHYFRGGFLLAGEQQTTFFVSGDNLPTLYLNGVPIMGELSDLFIWRDWHEVTLELPAGFHTVGVVVENVDAPDLAYNPGGMIMNAVALSVYPGDTQTSLTIALLSSNAADWVSIFSADEAPGWTPGQILLQLISEATTRGALVQYAGETFAAFLDSDGGAWDTIDPDTTTEFIPTFSVKEGTTMLSVLAMMHDQGWIDYHFHPDTLTLDVWAAGAHGASSGVVFEDAADEDTPGNIASLNRSETKSYANALKVQWDKGSTWVVDAAEITAYGTRVEDMFATDAATEYEAQRLGRVELLRRATAARNAVLVEIEPRAQAEAPYEGSYGLGDYADFPDEDGLPVEQQILAIRCVGDDENRGEWTLEVNSRWRAPEARLEELLRQIGGKTIGSPSNHGVARD